MSLRRRAILPATLVGSSVLLGGWFLQEGVSREENVYLQVRLFQEVVDAVTDQYVEELDPSTLYDSAIDGILTELDDPNTSFIGASDWEDFRIRATEGDYGGVGLEVLPRDGFVTVVRVIPGGPGEKAGIRAGDRLVVIDGQDAAEMDVDMAIDILRGPAGSDVEVSMGRNGMDDPIPFSLTREVIQLKSVPFAVMLEDDIGYVPLQVFRTTSSDEVRDGIGQLQQDGARGVILDLRGNPGGLLDEGIDAARGRARSTNPVAARPSPGSRWRFWWTRTPPPPRRSWPARSRTTIGRWWWGHPPSGRGRCRPSSSSPAGTSCG